MARPKTQPWHEDERFWEVAAPVLYPAQALLAAPAEAEAITRWLALPPASRVLDQGCGPGAHALAFARLGHAVSGVDRTARFLAAAAHTARQEGLATRFEHGDVRTFVKPAAFELVVNIHGAYGMYDDPAEDDAVLQQAHASLVPGGQLVLAVRARAAVPAGVRQEDYREAEGLDLLEERILPAGSDRLAIHWVLYHGEARFEFHLHVRLYEPPDLTLALARAGFGALRFYADYAGQAYEPGAARLVAVARKEPR